ncbi:uncharacterized protein LOC127703825 [Mytilus californianus]|uniref:uncharacterized protein LOC127703825 n=1 Tax=Mytilus californianus TaxID=6549 RepID=UPI002245DF58|nr:uncharacterized protein LOC127703825 [Mytilus californianus]
MTACVYEKSHCNEEGQVIYSDNSTKDDRACRCDYKKGYSFIKTPRNVCYCIPTEEDCSCYDTSYSTNSTISADDSCTQSGIKENPNCIDITKFNKTMPEKNEKERILIRIENSNFRRIYKTDTTIFTILVLLCFMTIFVAGGFVFALLFDEWTSKKLQPLEMYFCRKHKAGKERLNVEELQPIKRSEITADEMNFLRIVHLLVRVACPVVRSIFNSEIQPNQLRKTLYRNKQKIVKRYRKKDTFINDFHWSKLFAPDIGTK